MFREFVAPSFPRHQRFFVVSSKTNWEHVISRHWGMYSYPFWDILFNPYCFHDRPRRNCGSLPAIPKNTLETHKFGTIPQIPGPIHAAFEPTLVSFITMIQTCYGLSCMDSFPAVRTLVFHFGNYVFIFFICSRMVASQIQQHASSISRQLSTSLDPIFPKQFGTDST